MFGLCLELAERRRSGSESGNGALDIRFASPVRLELGNGSLSNFGSIVRNWPLRLRPEPVAVKWLLSVDQPLDVIRHSFDCRSRHSLYACARPNATPLSPIREARLHRPRRQAFLLGGFADSLCRPSTQANLEVDKKSRGVALARAGPGQRIGEGRKPFPDPGRFLSRKGPRRSWDRRCWSCRSNRSQCRRPWAASRP